jgi:hypothetical protein
LFVFLETRGRPAFRLCTVLDHPLPKAFSGALLPTRALKAMIALCPAQMDAESSDLCLSDQKWQEEFLSHQ